MARSYAVAFSFSLTAVLTVVALGSGCGRDAAAPAAAPEPGDDDLDPVEQETTADDEPEPAAPDAPPPPPRPKMLPDYHAAAVRNAAEVFRTMGRDFRACYKTKLAANPNAHASMLFNVLIGPQGAVRSVDLTGGAMLGDDGRECLAARVRKATFAPVHGGGTTRIKVPMEFRGVLKARDAG